MLWLPLATWNSLFVVKKNFGDGLEFRRHFLLRYNLPFSKEIIASGIKWHLTTCGIGHTSGIVSLFSCRIPCYLNKDQELIRHADSWAPSQACWIRTFIFTGCPGGSDAHWTWEIHCSRGKHFSQGQMLDPSVWGGVDFCSDDFCRMDGITTVMETLPTVSLIWPGLVAGAAYLLSFATELPTASASYLI